MILKRRIFKFETIVMVASVFFLMLSSINPASSGINFYYTDGSLRNYTISDTVLNSLNLVKLVNGDIEMPSITLKFEINKTLLSGSKKIVINTSSFRPKTTSFPNQKAYLVSGSMATVSYTVDASSSFASTAVNVTTYRMVSNNVPFFSDFSIALLNFNDLKNTWSNDTKVLDMLIDTGNDGNKLNEVTVTLNSAGDTDTLTQSLAPGNYLILVTKGTNPKEIITSNIVKVMPFSSTTVVGDDSGFAAIGLDMNVNVTLSTSAPSDYTYITSIINRSDYADNLGNINITWNSGTLANATRVNGIVLYGANSITDLIPRSNTTRTTTRSTSANLVLKTGALTAGSYLVNTLVFNSTNLSVAFDQHLLTLGNRTTVDVTANINSTGYVNATLNITTANANITITIPDNTKATLSDGVTPIANITSYAPTEFNSTLEAAASGSNLKFLGENLTLLPAGAIFDPYILVRFNYSQADIPGDVSEDSLKAYWYNSTTGVWETLTTHDLNKTGNYLIARIPHLSTFALLGTITTTPPPSSSGGGGSGGGGGGGGSSGENYTNIEAIEKYDMQISRDALTSYRFTHTKNPILFVNITGNTSLGLITASIEVLKKTSILVKVPPEGLVYMNANIWVGTSGFATPKNIKEALIKFRVNNYWMSTNGVLASDIVLLKWDGKGWIYLDTKVLSKDDTNSYFEGWTNAFSPFAIVAKKEAGPKPAVTIPNPAGTSKISVIDTPEPRNIEKMAQKSLPGFGIVLAIAGLMAVVLRKRR